MPKPVYEEGDVTVLWNQAVHTDRLVTANRPDIIIKNKDTYNFYLVIEVPDHVYVFHAYRLYFADKDIYMIRYFYHKIEIIRVFINSIDISMGHTRSTKRYNAILY